MTRVIDVLVSAVALVVASPALLLAALGIKRASPGPVLYRAQRAGRDGVAFEMLKLRTMHVTRADGRITAAGDPRIFPVGRWLRRTKLDEFPQLWNVLRGDMALVGPRPEDVSIVEEHYNDFMRESLAVPPGVTGPGSLQYFAEERALPSDPAEVERIYLERLLAPKIALDLVYVRHRSVRYQLELILRTLAGIVGARGLFSAREAWESDQAALIRAEGS